jgi:hypothetical protein
MQVVTICSTQTCEVFKTSQVLISFVLIFKTPNSFTMKLTFTLIALFSCCLLNAQKAGTLDSSFGNSGKVLKGYNNGSL